MGTTTEFEGAFAITPQLTMDQHAELMALEEWPGPNEARRGGYCQWKPTRDGRGLEWDRGEKFYDYVECLEWLIAKKFKPWGRVLSGTVKFQGEDRDDRGLIDVRDNVVKKVDAGLFEKGKTPPVTWKNALTAILALRNDDDIERAQEIATEALKHGAKK